MIFFYSSYIISYIFLSFIFNEVMETITRKLIENKIKGGNNNINNNTPNKGVNLDNKNSNKTNSGCC